MLARARGRQGDGEERREGLPVLALVQAAHSVEEFVFRLWEVLAPARYAAGLLGLDPAFGFATVNAALVGFGLWCWVMPVRRGWVAAVPLMWGWGLVEAANGSAHLALAVTVRGYFPGLYTAPLLIGASLWLMSRLIGVRGLIGLARFPRAGALRAPRRAPTVRRMRLLLFALGLGLAAGASAAPVPGFHLVPGRFEPGRQPDGHSVFLDAPEGLILVDTGRHREHRDALIAYARARGRPIAAIVNTHWHLDHSEGNRAIRAAYPRARVYASTAVEGALTGFFPKSRANSEAFLESGQASRETTADIRGDLAAMADPDSLRPTDPVVRSAARKLARRRLEVNLARFAATEGDVWLYDPAERLVVAGDLVVAPVPFMDTACPEGWRRALGRIAARPFRTLIPGHGAPMDRGQFLAWRHAYGNLVDCGGSDRPRRACIDGWLSDAAAFVTAGEEKRVAGLVAYYLDTRLRAAPEERTRYCRPLR